MLLFWLLLVKVCYILLCIFLFMRLLFSGGCRLTTLTPWADAAGDMAPWKSLLLVDLWRGSWFVM